MTNNSKSYKRPVSVRRTNLAPDDKKFDLCYVLQHLRHHLLRLQLPGDVSDLPLFWQVKTCHLKPSDGFYLPKVSILYLSFPFNSIIS